MAEIPESLNQSLASLVKNFEATSVNALFLGLSKFDLWASKALGAKVILTEGSRAEMKACFSGGQATTISSLAT
ncbi:hypothetical protein D3C86_2183230 [compost metagenome]